MTESYLDQACRLLGRVSFFGLPTTLLKDEVETFLDAMQDKGYGIGTRSPADKASHGDR